MDHKDSSESDSAVDLEYGDTTSRDDEKVKELVYNDQHPKEMSSRKGGVVRGLNGYMESNDVLSISKDDLDSSDNVEMLAGKVGEEAMSLAEKKIMGEKWQKPKFKKHPKPPRPPGALSYDEADMMLVREISELSRLKQARIDRMKALKKRRGEKSSSSVINIFAMVITILFCIVIIFQGILGSHV